MSSVLKEALTLSVADRLQLLGEIWDSPAGGPEAIRVTNAQRKELARRRQAHVRSPSAAKSWEEARAKLERQKLGAFGLPTLRPSSRASRGAHPPPKGRVRARLTRGRSSGR